MLLCVFTVKFPCGVRELSKKIVVRALGSKLPNRTEPESIVSHKRVTIANKTISQTKGKITPSRSKLPMWYHNNTEQVNNRTRIIGGDSASPGEIPWQVHTVVSLGSS